MNGAEHYVESERLIGEYESAMKAFGEVMAKGGLTSNSSVSVSLQNMGVVLQGAQVHATLALAAASAPRNDGSDVGIIWARVVQ